MRKNYCDEIYIAILYLAVDDCIIQTGVNFVMVIAQTKKANLIESHTHLHTKLYWSVAEMKKLACFSLFCILIFCLNNSTRAQSLAVENVRFKQEIDSKVVVSYDLLGKKSQKYIIILSIFSPQSRKKVPLSNKSLSGDVGKAVSPGRGLEIVWVLRNDYPDGLEGEGFRFIIDAYIQQKSAGKWPWIVAGIAAAGGAVVLLTVSSTATPLTEPDLPSPPVLPPNQ